jgi:hypothetical protein
VTLLLAMTACWVTGADREAVIGAQRAVDTGPPDASCDAPSERVFDGGFEAGANGGYWSASSDQVDSPICSAVTCGSLGSAGPRSGAWWVWFGGLNEPESAKAVQRDVVLDPGPAELTFWLRVPERSSGDGDTLTVTVDGQPVWDLVTTDAGPYVDDYVLVTVDVTEHADGGAHELGFFGVTLAETTARTSFFIDDVSLVACP